MRRNRRSTVWLGVRPLYLSDPDGADIREFDYVREFGIGSAAVRSSTRTELKAIFGRPDD